MPESPVHSFPSPPELATWLPQFDVQQQVHAGRDSALYLGWQQTLDRRVVIEVIHEPAEAEITILLERLRNRARLVHPSITAVYDFGRTTEGFFYLVTEHVEGRSLLSLIQEEQIKPKSAFPLALQICEALQLVHDQGITHGALSPATVLVNHEGLAKLSCIGMAVTEAGELSWVEPFHGSCGDDLHDLGITLHWMFARTAPGDDGRLSRDLPPSFAAVLRRCLRQDPTKEWHRPAEVAEALNAALRNEQERGETPTRSKMVVAPGAKPASTPAQATPLSKATSAPPKPGVRQHRPSFFQRMDAFVWRAFSTGLHILISVLSIGSLVLLVLFKDRIVIEHQDTPVEEPAAQVETVTVEPPSEPVPADMPAAPPRMIVAPPEPAPAPIPVEKPKQIVVIKPAAAPMPPPPPSREERLANLRAQYVTAVQQAANQALETVRLDDLPYLQKELQLLQNGGDIPTVDETDLPRTLKAMRQRYRETYANIMR